MRFSPDGAARMLTHGGSVTSCADGLGFTEESRIGLERFVEPGLAELRQFVAVQRAQLLSCPSSVTVQSLLISYH